jgi:hypothetical protein
MKIFDFFRKIFKRTRNVKETVPFLSQVNQVENKTDAYADIKNIMQIDAIKGKDIISFKKISIKDIATYNYREISSDIVKGGLSNVTSAGTQIATISALNPNGLFSATVSPQSLTLFADGTYSTMIHQGGHIADHAGFLPASATVFAPIAMMQLMSMTTGQYYMNSIIKQLESIDKKINQLIQIHHTEKISKLENAHALLKELFEIQCPSIEHLMQLKTIEHEVGAIHKEYLRYLEELDYSYLQSKDTEFLSSDDMKNLLNTHNESEFSFKLYMAMTADNISHLIPIIEFALNVKINSMTKDRSNRINELFEKINKLKKEDFFAYSKGEIILEKYFSPFFKRAAKIRKNSWFYRDEIRDQILSLKDKKKQLGNEVRDSSISYEIKNKLVEQMNSPIELLCSIDNDGNTTMYVKQ